jgi:hypothetical protein
MIRLLVLRLKVEFADESANPSSMLSDKQLENRINENTVRYLKDRLNRTDELLHEILDLLNLVASVSFQLDVSASGRRRARPCRRSRKRRRTSRAIIQATSHKNRRRTFTHECIWKKSIQNLSSRWLSASITRRS